MAAYIEKWGPVLAKAGHTQICEGLLDGKKSRALGLSSSEVKTIIGIIRYQDNPKFGTVPSAKQLAYDSRVCYETTRKNLKNLTAYKKDGGLGLLIPVLLKAGRIRYNMMPLRRALEKLEKTPALQVVKPAKVRPAPKPEPIITIHQPDPDAMFQKGYSEPDDDAIVSWEEIKHRLKPEISEAAYENWIKPTRGDHWEGQKLWVVVPSGSHYDSLMGRFKELIRRCSRELFGNISIACKVLAAAALPI